MTIYELHFLISEYLGHITTTYESWFAASTAVLLAAHYIGNHLTQTLRRIVVSAYVLYSVNCFLGIIKFYYAISVYMGQIALNHGVEFPVVPVSDVLNAILLFSLFIAGTVIVSAYFVRSTHLVVAASSAGNIGQGSN